MLDNTSMWSTMKLLGVSFPTNKQKISKMLMSSPIVSIITPVYNAEKFIAETITSILNQTFEDFELIIVNDGSTDKSADIIQSFRDSRIRYVYQENASQAVARNKGIELSKGQFIAFCDADDIWHPDKLKIQLEKMLNLNSDFSFTKICDISELLKPHTPPSEKCHSAWYLKNLLIKNDICTSSVMIKKKLLIENNMYFRNGRRGVEDFDLWLRLTQLTPFLYIDQSLVGYREHPDGDSKNPELMSKGVEQTINDFYKEIIALEDKNFLRKLAKNYKYHSFLQYGHNALQNKDFGTARRLFIKALKLKFYSARPLWGLLKTIIVSRQI